MPAILLTRDDDDEQKSSTAPFRYAIIPIVAAFFAVTTFYFFLHRRNKRRNGPSANTPFGFWVAPDGSLYAPIRRRLAPSHGIRSQEGLNELGEAPPAYDGKRGPEHHEVEDVGGSGPPDYPAEPPPAVTREPRS